MSTQHPDSSEDFGGRHDESPMRVGCCCCDGGGVAWWADAVDVVKERSYDVNYGESNHSFVEVQ